MARARRKGGGVKKGAFRKKKMGKGWAAHRRTPKPVKPLTRSASEGTAEDIHGAKEKDDNPDEE